MSIFSQLFTWWNGQTIGTRLYTARKGQLVGEDDRHPGVDGNFRVLCDLKRGDLSKSLVPGLTATVTLTLRSKKDALTVPSAAVRVDDGDPSRRYVTVVDGEKERRVKVRVGLSHGGRTEILSGLEEGQRVIVEKDA